jgi:hypothetical protein
MPAIGFRRGAGGYPCSDGRFPLGNVVFDTSGNLYGTTEQGGTYDGGVVWEITGLN